MALSKLVIGGLLAAGAVALCACSPKSPPDPAPAPPAASDQASSGDAAAAVSDAAQPAAGTVANARGENQRGGKPAVDVQEEVSSRGDEAPQGLRDKVDAAKAAGQAPPQTPGGPAQ